MLRLRTYVDERLVELKESGTVYVDEQRLAEAIWERTAHWGDTFNVRESDDGSTWIVERI